jgi:hypothetical protein
LFLPTKKLLESVIARKRIFRFDRNTHRIFIVSRGRNFEWKGDSRSVSAHDAME